MLGRVVGLVLAGAVVLGACASEADPPAAERSNTPRVTTPGVSEPGGTPDDADLLLSEGDVRAVGGFSDATASDIGDAAVYENPDPRGPCGTPIAALPGGDLGRAFMGPAFSALQFVYIDAGELAPYIEAVEADLRPGCGGHESTTNTGAVQQVAEPVPVDLSGIGDRAIGWMTTITVAGQTVSGGTALTVAGERATVVQIVGDGVAAGQVEALARTAAERLAG